jgi:hypothetical protein
MIKLRTLNKLFVPLQVTRNNIHMFITYIRNKHCMLRSSGSLPIAIKKVIAQLSCCFHILKTFLRIMLILFEELLPYHTKFPVSIPYREINSVPTKVELLSLSVTFRTKDF